MKCSAGEERLILNWNEAGCPLEKMHKEIAGAGWIFSFDCLCFYQ